MGLIAVPNVSEGRDPTRIAALAQAVQGSGCRVLDTHSDEVHNRTVYTVVGTAEQLVDGMKELACAARSLDLRSHEGVHPRLGVLDVCPIVPHDTPMEEAVDTAVLAARSIGEACSIPTYLYGHAARRSETRDLPALRAGGLEGLMERARLGLLPDFGPHVIDPRSGVVCVGARGPLIAFNVWVGSTGEVARRIARAVRSDPVRALGLQIDDDRSQISMNLIDPTRVGIDEAFETAKEAASKEGVGVLATEIVGVPFERYMPAPHKEAARLLLKPGRSFEAALTG
jgi:glutamate formiminotransferase